LGSGVEITILQLAERLNTLLENETPIAFKPARDWDRSGQRFADTTKARIKLGFKAAVGHEEGLRRTIDWTRANRSTILRCMLGHAHFVPEVRRYALSNMAPS
jgi:nucleoside-diphosphate-sugar epimerase